MRPELRREGTAPASPRCHRILLLMPTSQQCVARATERPLGRVRASPSRAAAAAVPSPSRGVASERLFAKKRTGRGAPRRTTRLALALGPREPLQPRKTGAFTSVATVSLFVILACVYCAQATVAFCCHIKTAHRACRRASAWPGAFNIRRTTHCSRAHSLTASFWGVTFKPIAGRNAPRPTTCLPLASTLSSCPRLSEEGAAPASRQFSF